MWEWIKNLAALFAVLGVFWSLYVRLLKPRRLKARLVEFAHMVMDWFDDIDCNLETGLNLSSINNKENKIRAFIKNKLPSYRIVPSKKLIRNWNKEMGLKEEYWDSPDKFQQYSRIPCVGISVDNYFIMLTGKLQIFYSQYLTVKSSIHNFAEIAMPIKFLKFYLKDKGCGE